MAAETDEERLWALVLDLSAQLTANKQTIETLKAQLDALQGQSVHAMTGVALRRFNVDLSQEAFTTQLERLNVQLMTENTSLAHETKQLGSLLRECEGTLETVMGKFRSFSYAAQQYGLDLSAYYERRLAAQARDVDAHAQGDTARTNAVIGRIGSLLRDAISEVDGERPRGAGGADGDAAADALEEATEVEQLRHENELLRALLGMRLGASDADRSSVADLSVAQSAAGRENVDTAGAVDEVDTGVAA